MQDHIFTIAQLYKSVNNVLNSNLSLFKGFLIENISIDKELSPNEKFNASFYTATSTGEKGKNYKINIQISNSIINEFIKYNKPETGIKLNIRIQKLYIVANGTITIQASEIKEAGLSDREIKNKRLQRYIEANKWEQRSKRTLPRLISSLYAITSMSSDIQADILENLNIKKQKIVKCKSSADIAEKIGSDLAQSCDIIVLYRGGHEDANMDIFSDEVILDAIVKSNIPVCTALGHQNDMPFITSFSDVNFSTPSEFAKNISSRNDEVKRDIHKNLYEKIRNNLTIIRNIKKDKIDYQRDMAQINVDRILNNLARKNKAKEENIDTLVKNILYKKKNTVSENIKGIETKRQKIIIQKRKENRNKAKLAKKTLNSITQKIKNIKKQKRKEKKIIMIAVIAIVVAVTITIFTLR